jgi:hypothetical protein
MEMKSIATLPYKIVKEHSSWVFKKGCIFGITAQIPLDPPFQRGKGSSSLLKGRPGGIYEDFLRQLTCYI